MTSALGQEQLNSSAIGMSGRLERKNKRSIATGVLTALSSTAAFMSVVTTEPGRKPLPGIRTAVELLAKTSERGPSKLVSEPILTSASPRPVQTLENERQLLT